MNYSTTIHLSENDLKEIIKRHFKTSAGFDLKPEDISFKVSRESRGYGMGEYEKTVFKGCDVNVKEKLYE